MILACFWMASQVSHGSHVAFRRLCLFRLRSSCFQRWHGFKILEGEVAREIDHHALDGVVHVHYGKHLIKHVTLPPTRLAWRLGAGVDGLEVRDDELRRRVLPWRRAPGAAFEAHVAEARQRLFKLFSSSKMKLFLSKSAKDQC